VSPRETTQERRMRRQRNAAFSLFITSSLLGKLMERERGRARVRSSDIGLLSAIGMYGPITPSGLAERIGMPPTTLSARIADAVARRWVRRVRNPEDGRSYLLELTAEGRRAWQRWGPVLQATLAQIEQHLERPIDDVEETLVELEAALRRALADTTKP